MAAYLPPLKTGTVFNVGDYSYQDEFTQTSRAVTLAGDQIISGLKIFSKDVTMQNDLFVHDDLGVTDQVTCNAVVANVSLSAPNVTATALSCANGSFTGSVSCNTAVANVSLSAPNVTATALSCANGSFTGSVSCNSVVANTSVTAPNVSATSLSCTDASFSGNLNSIPAETFAFLGNVSSDIQAQLLYLTLNSASNQNAQIKTLSTTGTISFTNAEDDTIESSLFTVQKNMVVGSNSTNTLTINSSVLANGKTVSPTQLGFLANVSSDLQPQITSLVTGLGATDSNLSASVASLSGDIALRAPLASPALTGIPVAPTAANTTNSTQIATTAFVQNAVSQIVGGSPLALDTLTELAAALNNDALFASTVTNSLATKAPLASPSLTGLPTCPTAANSTNSTQIASTAFVQNNLVSYAPLANPTFTGTVNVANLTTTNLTDNGNLLVKGNTTIGDAVTDSLIVVCPTTFSNTVSGLSKSMVGLFNCDNTSDANKPVSSATQTALNLKSDLDSPNFTGIPTAPTASLADSTTKIATTSYVQQNLANKHNTINSGNRLNANLVADGSVSNITWAFLDPTSSVQTQLNSKLASSSASSTYLTIADPSPTGSLVIPRMLEKFSNSYTFSSNTLTVDVGSIGCSGVYFTGLTASTNFTLTLTSVPDGVTYRTFDFSLLIDPASYQAYANALNVNGSAVTIRFLGGTPSLTGLTSSGLIVQSIHVVYSSSGTTVGKALSSVSIYY